ncbi:hypothetical protein QJQ45_020989 [Haematococcus lacustris]|nr:hypothetical protein QJQ45_020989 [Haematococcus lacustris]
MTRLVVRCDADQLLTAFTSRSPSLIGSSRAGQHLTKPQACFCAAPLRTGRGHQSRSTSEVLREQLLALTALVQDSSTSTTLNWRMQYGIICLAQAGLEEAEQRPGAAGHWGVQYLLRHRAVPSTDPAHLQHLAAARSAGTSLEANQKHITVTLATWDMVWEVHLDPHVGMAAAQAVWSPWALKQFVTKVAGTRGDVQPSLALGLRLQQHGHTVRLATHEAHRQLVLEEGLQHFFPLKGDPVVLTEVTVKSKGIMPCSLGAFTTIRQQYRDIIYSTWDAATAPLEPGGPPLKPDLVVTNPLCYGAPHVAEALDIPLHLVSAVPWAPSELLAHPWARAWDQSLPELIGNIFDWFAPAVVSTPFSHSISTQLVPVSRQASIPEAYNFPGAARLRQLSSWHPLRRYSELRDATRSSIVRFATWGSTWLLDHTIWVGIVDILAAYRVTRLNLPPFTGFNGTRNLYSCPTSFVFSPSLLPKPADWPEHMAVTGALLLHTPDEQEEEQQDTPAGPQAPPQPVHSAPDAEARKAKQSDALRVNGLGKAALSTCGGAAACSEADTAAEHADDMPSAVSYPAMACVQVQAVKHQHREVAGCDTAPAGPCCEQENDCPAVGNGESEVQQAVAGQTQQHNQEEEGAAAELGVFNDQRQRHSGTAGKGQDFKPPANLLRFLAAGPPPVYIGMGSAAVSGTQHAADLILQAAAKAQTRVVVHRPTWAGLTLPVDAEGEGLMSPWVFVVGDTPHHWLLPRCCAVVHHGGAGTLFSGIQAGCPTLVCPCYGDNYFWGELIQKLGAGPAPLSIFDWTVDSLAQALRKVQVPKYAAAAAHLQAQVRKERGLDNAVRHLYAHWPVPERVAAPADGDAMQPAHGGNVLATGAFHAFASAPQLSDVRPGSGAPVQGLAASIIRSLSTHPDDKDGSAGKAQHASLVGNLSAWADLASKKLCRFWY